MIFALFSRVRWPILPLFAMLCIARVSAEDHKFTTSPTLSTEAQNLVQLLEQAHYNRDAVKNDDYAQAIPEFMKALDGQHLCISRCGSHGVC